MKKGDRKMRINKFALLIALAIASVLFFEVAAHADEADQSTKITFSQPVEIPGHVLPAGTYLFKLADENDQNLIQIFNANGTRVFATLQTISVGRQEPTGDAVATLAEQPDGGPDALLDWFFPGNTIGHEFRYSNKEEQQLAHDRQQTIAANETAQAGD
ncbi:DUF2911 domain-containing protein [Edaphobacter sp. HDX4]|uniref:hypothetical protein n=1 Tax=Edaphobacter sp. HDX4 TaxID=2794064 RepID=UPI002FE6216F